MNFTRKLADEEFRKGVEKIATDYWTVGYQEVTQNAPYYDAANDMLQAVRPQTQKDFEAVAKGMMPRFMLPIATTHNDTMAKHIVEVLCGDRHPNKVIGRAPEDDAPAEHMNALLAWQADQQQMYQLYYLWIQDGITYNRGIVYESWHTVSRVLTETVDEPTGEVEMDEETGELVEVTEEVERRTRKDVASFTKLSLVSPYDFVVDPTLPSRLFQEGRFAGHRVLVSYEDLVRRTKLKPSHPEFILPSAVRKLKQKNKRGITSLTQTAATASANTKGSLLSPTAMSRKKSIDTALNGTQNTPGMFWLQEMWVKLVPADHGLGDDEQPRIFQMVLLDGKHLCALHESTYNHNEFPYSVCEPRPSAHEHVGPSWMLMLKPVQDYIDFLKDKHQEAINRTIGNVIAANPAYIDLEQFTDPDKEGKIIEILPEGQDKPIGDIIKQIPIQDVTARFPAEMSGFVALGQTVTGATGEMQGFGSQADSASQFVGQQKLASSRLSVIAKLISDQGVRTQTMHMVENFLQFWDDEMYLKVKGSTYDMDPYFNEDPRAIVNPETIMGDFDFVTSDGTMPTGDMQKIAGLTKILEMMAVMPNMFAPGVGNIDPRRVSMDYLKTVGANVENYKYRAQELEAIRNQQLQIAAQRGVEQGVEQAGSPAQPGQGGSGSGGASPTGEDRREQDPTRGGAQSGLIREDGRPSDQPLGVDENVLSL